MRRVLVVDDHADVGRALVAMVRHLGGHADYVGGGEAALAYARAYPLDVMLLDYMMPDLDGLAVLAALRADPRTRELTVLLWTASCDGPWRDRAVELGVAAIFDKGSIGPDELRPWVAPPIGAAAAAVD